jgi:hypothetical protein
LPGRKRPVSSKEFTVSAPDKAPSRPPPAYSPDLPATEAEADHARQDTAIATPPETRKSKPGETLFNGSDDSSRYSTPPAHKD